MRPRNNWLMYIGVALGALALVVAVAGRFDSVEQGSNQPGWHEQVRMTLARSAELAQRDQREQHVGPSDAAEQEGQQDQAAAGSEQDQADLRALPEQDGQRGPDGANGWIDRHDAGHEHDDGFELWGWAEHIAQGGVAVLGVLAGSFLLLRSHRRRRSQLTYTSDLTPVDGAQQVSDQTQSTRTVYL